MTEPGEHQDTTEARLDRRFAIGGRLAAAVAILLGALVLVGWADDLEWITNPLGEWPMAPNTALLFVTIGVALALSIPSSPSRARRWGARALALVSGTLAVLTLAEHAFAVVIDSGAIFGPGGEIRYRATYIQDITEDKRAEAERARLAAIVRSTDDAILSMTLDGTVLDWNRAAERVFGYAAEEMIGRPIDIIVPEDRRAERSALIAKTLEGEPVVGFETIRVRKDGQQVPVALTMSVLRDSSGRASGISVIERDISVLKQFQREREEWSAVVAHDLRQPASMIRYAAEMLRDLDGEPKQRMLARVDNACGRLEQMIEDLLDVSRIDGMDRLPGKL